MIVPAGGKLKPAAEQALALCTPLARLASDVSSRPVAAIPLGLGPAAIGRVGRLVGLAANPGRTQALTALPDHLATGAGHVSAEGPLRRPPGRPLLAAAPDYDRNGAGAPI